MKLRLCVIGTLYIIFSINFVNAQGYQNAKEHTCLKCHASQTFHFNNPVIEKEQKRMMNPYYVLDTVALNSGVHVQFDCTDCHDYEYTNYPHNAELKLQPLSTCIDCHGGDESYASYQFERIEEEFRKSVHYTVYGDDFSCAKCHSQHTYSATARNSSNVLKIVDYSNKMCLSCHGEMIKYQTISEKEQPQILQVHHWLPNQELHFKHVRCIECHTEVVDSLNVSHNILKKEFALKKCVECHSENSRLKASLYKYENLQKRYEDKSIKSLLSNESYIIGSMQSPFLKMLSYIIFFSVLLGIAIHLFFRIYKK